MIGRNEGSVTAHAKAEVKYLTGLNSVFPVALLMMNPDHFELRLQSPGGSTAASFDLRDTKLGQSDDEGLYNSGGVVFTPTVAGNYSVTSADDTTDSHEVGLELPEHTASGGRRIPNPTARRRSTR